MHTLNTKSDWRRVFTIALALISVVLPLSTVVIVSRETTALPSDPTPMMGYGPTVAALILGLVCAVGAFVGVRALNPAWLRWLNIVLAILGVLIGGFLLLSLIGTCGLGVLGGACNP
jgi:hypothetical protein